MRVRATLAALLLAGCATTGGQGAPEPSAEAPARGTGRLCLPLVSGCGCSYACADEVRHADDGTYEVTWWGQDSRTDRATLGRLCLPDGRCRDAFRDESSCGGECIPTAEHFGCHRDAAGACVP